MRKLAYDSRVFVIIDIKSVFQKGIWTMMLKQGDRIGLVACSNAMEQSEAEQLQELVDTLKEMGLVPVLSPYLFRRYSVFGAEAQARADALHALYMDESVKAIFDISGGDIANEILTHLDFEQITAHPKPFFGYSDLTAIINAIYEKTGACSYLYQLKCLVWEDKYAQREAFQNSLLRGQNDLFHAKWTFIRGRSAVGVVVGGNIRCLLKLAGTPFMPDLSGKLLFLESYGGGAAQMTAFLSQLLQMGAFDQIAGLLLGTFTKMEETCETPDMTELVYAMTKDFDFPIAKTHDIGHANSSNCMIIGTKQSFAQSD